MDLHQEPQKQKPKQQKRRQPKKKSKDNQTNNGTSRPEGRRHPPQHPPRQQQQQLPPPRRAILVLHGNHQTGELLLGRMKPFRKKLLHQDRHQMLEHDSDHRIQLVAPDAPFEAEEDDPRHNNDHGGSTDSKNASPMKTWWYRKGNEYEGLETSLEWLQSIWDSNNNNNNNDHHFEGIFGFSQGARLAHLMALRHQQDSNYIPNLKYVILASGYGHVPLPTNFISMTHNTIPSEQPQLLQIQSLHCMGRADRLIPPDASRALLPSYAHPQIHEHDGGHHVPMKAADVQVYLDFIDRHCHEEPSPRMMDGTTLSVNTSSNALTSLPLATEMKVNGATTPKNEGTSRSTDKQQSTKNESDYLLEPPNEEMAEMQREEVEALSMIFPDDVTCQSAENAFPISYVVALHPQESDDEPLWPPGKIAVSVTYPPQYPDLQGPQLFLQHDMNVLQFSSRAHDACLLVMQQAAEAELGMPCVMSCLQAARDFFDSGGLANLTSQQANDTATSATKNNTTDNFAESTDRAVEEDQEVIELLRKASPERISQCNLEGLEIATAMLGHHHMLDAKQRPGNHASKEKQSMEASNAKVSVGGNGGSWKYTIGLVGKPSAGKSTFFNAATAFARQKGSNSDVGGATMAPHPFTTIDPNIGYCLVPAPPGSCPEEDGTNHLEFGSTHGRDSKGRRLIPVMLKDVAGLVPGAYQGRGRGNKFLDDLTDADVLIHVVDASGTADMEGNVVGNEDGDGVINKHGAGSHPLADLAWVRNELIEWVYFNLASKWSRVVTKGPTRLLEMFSGYKQSQAFVFEVLVQLERYMRNKYNIENTLDQLGDWDEGDLHRLVSAFLGVRFPMALALNKSDLPSAASNVPEVLDALPIHGAHVGIPLTARSEMSFVRYHISSSSHENDGSEAPNGVWQCLQSAMRLREPVLVFPVCDMVTYEPLAGMKDYATRDSSLPSPAMIDCLRDAGGMAPSLWDSNRSMYVYESSTPVVKLRDVVAMKPGSTVEDVFFTLKRMGALGGEFVRAEGASEIGEKAKLVPKQEIVSKKNRILKIMTNKRKEWQKTF